MTSNFTKEISKGYKNKSSNLILLKSQSLSVTKRLNLNGVYQGESISTLMFVDKSKLYKP